LEIRDLKDDMKAIEAQDKKDFTQPLGLQPLESK